jgi:hypothetical protein
MAVNIKEREVVRKIEVNDECTYFMQALLEDTGLVAVSLGGKGYLTIFYDRVEEEEINFLISEIRKLCAVENFLKKLYNKN